MYKVSIIDKITFILVLIGAINWGLIGLLNKNLVKLLSFGSVTAERIIYILVFVSALNLILLAFKSKYSSSKKIAQ